MFLSRSTKLFSHYVQDEFQKEENILHFKNITTTKKGRCTDEIMKFF